MSLSSSTVSYYIRQFDVCLEESEDTKKHWVEHKICLTEKCTK